MARSSRLVDEDAPPGIGRTPKEGPVVDQVGEDTELLALGARRLDVEARPLHPQDVHDGCAFHGCAEVDVEATTGTTRDPGVVVVGMLEPEEHRALAI